MSESAFRYYGVRRVNPFRGVYQVIESSAGRAISANGVVWDIQVIARRPNGWGSLNRDSSEQAFLQYGLWSAKEGLVSRPLTPSLSSDPLSRRCQTVIDGIERYMDQLPLQLIDHRELWLFDRDQQPLVLLASLTPEQQPPKPEPRHWSACVGMQGVPSQHRFGRTAELEALVRSRAGFNIDKRWIQRQPDGSGIVTASGNQLPNSAFPELLLSEQWPQAEQAELVADYLNWTAPSLLTLQRLSDAKRERLEQSLQIQAISIEHHWHLYPKLINENHLKVARVQCRLMSAQSG